MGTYLTSSSVGSFSFLRSSSFSFCSLSSSPHSSLSSSLFLSSSPLYLESSQRAPSVLVHPTSRPSTLPSQGAIVGHEWSSSPSSAPYSVVYTASVGTSNIPLAQNRPSGERHPWPSQSSHSLSHRSTSFWPLDSEIETSILAKSSSKGPCSCSTS